MGIRTSESLDFCWKACEVALGHENVDPRFRAANGPFAYGEHEYHTGGHTIRSPSGWTAFRKVRFLMRVSEEKSLGLENTETKFWNSFILLFSSTASEYWRCFSQYSGVYIDKSREIKPTKADKWRLSLPGMMDEHTEWKLKSIYLFIKVLGEEQSKRNGEYHIVDKTFKRFK